MELSKLNSLVELFFKKSHQIQSRSDKPFLRWLKDNKKGFLSWKEVSERIFKLSSKLKTLIKHGDRC